MKEILIHQLESNFINISLYYCEEELKCIKNVAFIADKIISNTSVTINSGGFTSSLSFEFKLNQDEIERILLENI